MSKKGSGSRRSFPHTNTACTSSIYSAVPPAMDKSTFPFQRCSTATAAAERSSGSPWGAAVQETFFRQYTTRRPMTAAGSTRPRYSTTAGGSFFSGNSQKGSHRVIWVPAATARMMAMV